MKKYSLKQTKNPVTNIAFYYILANPQYYRQFNYFPAGLENRENFIIDGEDNNELGEDK